MEKLFDKQEYIVRSIVSKINRNRILLEHAPKCKEDIFNGRECVYEEDIKATIKQLSKEHDMTFEQAGKRLSYLVSQKIQKEEWI